MNQTTDWIDDLSATVETLGQAEVARRMDCSSATIHQLRTRQYRTDTLDRWRARFEAEFAQGHVACPVLGEMTRAACSRHRRRRFAATNPLRVRLFAACRTCLNNPDRGDL